MRYIWPYYLPSNSTAAYTFFQPAVETILSRLRDSHVLESCARVIARPGSLKSVPLDQFASQEGIPFTLGPHTEARYLSLRYPQWVVEATSSIGVSKLSPREFLQDLAALIAGDEGKFRARSANWHSHLATALFKLVGDTDLLTTIMDMCIIPLQNGGWVSAKGQSIFFSRAGSSLEVPSGISVLVVDAIAESDSSRRRLFASLGVKDWEVSEICRLVLQVHASPNFKPESLQTAQLVSHAKFLWKASWQPPNEANLWFATTQDKRCRGKDLYILGSAATGSAAARVFAHLQDEFPVIHKEYLETSSLDGEWHDWLVRHLKLSRIPRLVTPQVDPKPQPVEASRFQSEIPPDTPVDQNPGKITTKKAADEPPPPPPGWPDSYFISNGFHDSQANQVLNDFDFDSFLHEEPRLDSLRTSDDPSMPMKRPQLIIRVGSSPEPEPEGTLNYEEECPSPACSGKN